LPATRPAAPRDSTFGSGNDASDNILQVMGNPPSVTFHILIPREWMNSLPGLWRSTERTTTGIVRNLGTQADAQSCRSIGPAGAESILMKTSLAPRLRFLVVRTGDPLRSAFTRGNRAAGRAKVNVAHQAAELSTANPAPSATPPRKLIVLARTTLLRAFPFAFAS